MQGLILETIDLSTVDRNRVRLSNTTPLVEVELITKLTILSIEVVLAITIYIGRFSI